MDSASLHSISSKLKFKLDRDFVQSFSKIKAPFGFNGLGEFVYRRTYSRVKPNGEGEQWFETVERVVNGTYNMQKQWVEESGLEWKPGKAQRSAQEMYTRIFELKFSPPGRGLWAMGSPLTEKKKLYAALNNCAFVSTDRIDVNPAKPFTFLMDAAMLGIGVGFDTVGAGKTIVKGFKEGAETRVYVIPDSREGWVKSVDLHLEAFFKGLAPIEFDYSKIRPAGLPIKNFGGVSSGPAALQELHTRIGTTLSKEIGQPVSITAIVDLMNHIGVCVVSGNVRRTAEIAFGDPNSEEYIDLKNYKKNPERMMYGWTSNNSVFAPLGMDYGKVCDRVASNGEPGFAWLDNMKRFGRMNGVEDHRDHRAKGGNPCLEQTLEPFEMCCLVETFPARHETKADFLRTLKFAYLYAKTVTLGRTHWPETNRVMLRNRRIGCSMSGLAQFVAKSGLETLRIWCEEGYDTIQRYDEVYSEWLAIPRSIKTTSIKPSGTVSLLAGATPGMHFPLSRFYLRRVRLPKDSDLIPPLQAAGLHVEPAVGMEETTSVVSFPIDAGEGLRAARDVSMWEQLSFAAFLQRHWADNQVSCTISFHPKTEGQQLQHALSFFQYQLKGISFLPNEDHDYPQLPYQPIASKEYERLAASITTVDYSVTEAKNPEAEKFCDGDKCQFVPRRSKKEDPASPDKLAG